MWGAVMDSSSNKVRQQILLDWMEGGFRNACNHDHKRLLESLWVMKVGVEADKDTAEQVMAKAIASFVVGLIEGTTPITVPTENN